MCRGLHVVRETFVQSSKVVIIRVSSPRPLLLRVDLLAYALTISQIPANTGYNVLSAAFVVNSLMNIIICNVYGMCLLLLLLSL